MFDIITYGVLREVQAVLMSVSCLVVIQWVHWIRKTRHGPQHTPSAIFATAFIFRARDVEASRVFRGARGGATLADLFPSQLLLGRRYLAPESVVVAIASRLLN